MGDFSPLDLLQAYQNSTPNGLPLRDLGPALNPVTVDRGPDAPTTRITVTPEMPDQAMVGNPMGEVYPPGVEANVGQTLSQILRSTVGVPGDVAYSRNPYPPGSEEWNYFEATRQSGGLDWSIQQALSNIGMSPAFKVPEQALTAGAARRVVHDPADIAAAQSELQSSYGDFGSHPHEQALTVNDILHPDTPSLEAKSQNVEDIARGLNDRGSSALRQLGVDGGKIEGSAHQVSKQSPMTAAERMRLMRARKANKHG